MKKYIKVLALLPALLMSFSCSSNNSNKIAYLQSTDGKIAIIDSADGKGTNSDLIKMMNLKKSFVFYVSSSGCSSCLAFNRMLQPYLEKNPLLIYTISLRTYDTMSSSTRNSLGLPGSILTPTLFFIKSGKVVNYTSYDATTFTDEIKFEELIKRYGVMTDIKYSLSKADDAYAEETDSSTPAFDDSFSGSVIYYETLTSSVDSILAKQTGNDYYAYDLTAQISIDDYRQISQEKFETYLESHNITSKTKITLPFIADYESGTVTSVTNL